MLSGFRDDISNDHLDDYRESDAPLIWFYHCPNGDCAHAFEEWETSMSPPEHRILAGGPARCVKCMAVATFRCEAAS